nr:MAG TPA: hypothetical protein [Caudoviricetes sp.]DAX05455.1 MAG TPA: hypothetical protein [Bacteriophage sp.]
MIVALTTRYRVNLKLRTYSIFDLCEFQAVSMGSRYGLSTIHGFVAWCYEKIKSMLGKCRYQQFYGWIFSRRC